MITGILTGRTRVPPAGLVPPCPVLPPTGGNTVAAARTGCDNRLVRRADIDPEDAAFTTRVIAKMLAGHLAHA